MGPVVPGGEVEVVLRCGAKNVGLQATIVVIKLHPDSIKVYSPVEHGVISSIWVRALRRSGQVVLLAGV